MEKCRGLDKKILKNDNRDQTELIYLIIMKESMEKGILWDTLHMKFLFLSMLQQEIRQNIRHKNDLQHQVPPPNK